MDEIDKSNNVAPTPISLADGDGAPITKSLESAARTLAYSHGAESNWVDVAKGINSIAEQMASGDSSSGFQFLLSHVVVLDEIFNELTKQAISTRNEKSMLRLLDHALKAQNSSRQCLDIIMNNSSQIAKRNAKAERMIGNTMERIGGARYSPITGEIINTAFDPENMTFSATGNVLNSDLPVKDAIYLALSNNTPPNHIIKAAIDAYPDIDKSQIMSIIREYRQGNGDIDG